jgi:precorrin-6A/cobalt-precorrin-6A reductase
MLILGGTTEALALADSLSNDSRFAPVYSLAGATRAPRLPAIPVRTGGFGGAEGLARFLHEHAIDVLVVATHPFAAQIRRNAIEAARQRACPLLIVERPAWSARPDDRWIHVRDMQRAAAALGAEPKRVLLTIGRRELAGFAQYPQHHYIVRTIDAPPLDQLPPNAELLTARGPFDESNERELLRRQRIDILVTKNAGGAATEAKLIAARACGVPVLMVDRPPMPSLENLECLIAGSIQEALVHVVRLHHEHRSTPRRV